MVSTHRMISGDALTAMPRSPQNNHFQNCGDEVLHFLSICPTTLYIFLLIMAHSSGTNQHSKHVAPNFVVVFVQAGEDGTGVPSPPMGKSAVNTGFTDSREDIPKSRILAYGGALCVAEPPGAP